MSGLRFTNLHRDALGRVPLPKRNRGNGRHAATPLQDGLQNAGEKVSPEPEETGPVDLPETATPRMAEIWPKLFAAQRQLFHGPAWHKPQMPEAPVNALVEFMRQCRPAYHVTIDDLVSVRFADGFQGNSEHGEFHEQWARRQWTYLDDQEREAADDLRANALPFKWGAALDLVLDTLDFVEGLLTNGCLAVVYGDSNVGKSFWAIDLGLHIAGGIDWNGRAVEKGIVIYVSLEGGNIDNRIIAARKRLKLPPTVPIAVVQCPIDLRTNSVHADKLVKTVKLAMSELAGHLPVRLVVIDTMSRALNGGSEGAEDMSALVANVDRIRADTGVAVLFVAHCGKDAARGIRGWSGIRAAIDVEIEITRLADDGFLAAVTKQRDLPVGDRFGFKLDVVTLGKNTRDKAVTTCVIVPTLAAPRAADIDSDPRGRGRPGKHVRHARNYLADLLVLEGQKGHQGVPPSLPSVAFESWRTMFYDRAGVDPKNRTAFWRASESLIAAEVVAKCGERVWLTGKEGL